MLSRQPNFVRIVNAIMLRATQAGFSANPALIW
jgi:hypothetical protein